jgi:hypothetical protein
MLFAVKNMQQSQKGVAPQQARTGVPHNLAELGPVPGGMAVVGAPDANRFGVFERAEIESLPCMLKQFPAGRAQGFFASVVRLAIESKHAGQCLLFPTNAVGPDGWGHVTAISKVKPTLPDQVLRRRCCENNVSYHDAA